MLPTAPCGSRGSYSAPLPDRTRPPPMEGELPMPTLFYSDQHLCYAESLPPHEVVARIEVAVLGFLRNLCSAEPSVPDLPLVSTRSNNRGFRKGLMSEISSVFLSNSICARSLMKSKDAKAFVRVWKTMEICLQLVSQRKMVTQRELFYKLLCDSPEYFKTQSQVNRTVQGVIALLRCSRHSLGIMASTRGTIAGRLLIQIPDQDVIDCSTLGPTGFNITGDLGLLDNMFFESDARYILVVEKDAIFQRLAEDRIFNQIPSILITAKGYPDIATRFLLHRLTQRFPELPIFALVDWNPAGLAILCIYKFGSVSMGLEAYRYACNVKWIGLRMGDLQQIPSSSLEKLKPHDLRVAKSLMASKMLPENYREELSFMVEKGNRADIEALYCHGYDFLLKYIGTKITQADYI